ncbi:uncharacterized protein [Parasteatoda tepidariorum]|uniref:uncharacterized protein n=1 Tax=Parasteatoda tepidariorum TaxID=114398 RepID=UPI00077FB693|nr:venom peptide MmKTx1-like [Parasteatoda tepidariorum]XP_015924720.1 venom peptide MmKTx1-like [Parasteatoda tepidariorum]
MFYKHILQFWMFLLCVLQVKSYTVTMPLDTKSGFCNSFRFGKIPVGRVIYNFESCEVTVCDVGHADVYGCNSKFDPNRCTVIKEPGLGAFPDCCRDFICTGDNAFIL